MGSNYVRSRANFKVPDISNKDFFFVLFKANKTPNKQQQKQTSPHTNFSSFSYLLITIRPHKLVAVRH